LRIANERMQMSIRTRFPLLGALVVVVVAGGGSGQAFAQRASV
jgi:hypothetical protein